MGKLRTVAEINDRIASGKAVVMTAEQVVKLSKEKGADYVGNQVDVVTTATFGAMCSSGVFLNTGHSDPPMKMAQAWLNEVPAYCGVAAVDLYIGATEPSRDRGIDYGGAHVISDLVSGRKVKLRAFGYRTDCYPRLELDTTISLDDINQAIMCSPRNAYQNYCAATNSGQRILNTYMGTLLPNHGNVTYATTGEMSPLLKDPGLKTIGVGTPVFLAGAIGSIAWEGTQSFFGRPRNDSDAPIGPAATLFLVGDLKQMKPEYLQPAVFNGYGNSLYVGMGMAIPILDDEVAKTVCLSDDELETVVLDYNVGSRDRPTVARVTYGQLRRGEVTIGDKTPLTASMSSRKKAREICEQLVEMVEAGTFPLREPSLPLPRTEKLQPLTEGGRV